MNKRKVIPEILNRKSSVCFSDKPVTSEEIDLLIEAAKWAPSSRNMQPWKVIFVSKKDDSYSDVLASLSDSNQVWAKNAEIFAIFAIIDDKNINKIFLDIGFCGQNMMLQAEYLDIASHPMGGWSEDLVKKAVGIPEKNHVVFVLALGKKGNPEKLGTELKIREEKERVRGDNKDNFNFSNWDFN